MNPVYTSGKSNAQQFAAIARLYFPPDGLILDATYGTGTFWKTAKDFWLRPVHMDIQNRPGVHVVGDATAMPFPGGMFDGTVIDPPYMRGVDKDSAHKHDMIARYGLDVRVTWRGLMGKYGQMMAEGKRVTRAGGHLIVKGQDDMTNFFLRDLPVPPGLRMVDVHVVTPEVRPMMRHDYQKHARKNHSYFVVLKKSRWLVDSAPVTRRHVTNYFPVS